MKSSIIAATLALAFAVPASAAEWIIVSEGSNARYDARNGSAEYEYTNNTNEPVITMLFRLHDKPKGTLSFERKYVLLEDCRAGFGRVVTTTLNGSRGLYVNDFVLDGGNHSANIAKALCHVGRNGNSGVSL